MLFLLLPLYIEHRSKITPSWMTKMASTLQRKNKIPNKKNISFDTALNWEDEAKRTAHGVEVRRERKQRKKQRKMLRAEEERRVHEALAILRERGRLQAVIAVWGNIFIRNQLSLFLSEAGVDGDINTLDQRLDAFQDPSRVFLHRDLNENALDYLRVFTFHDAFVLEFFPAFIVSSSEVSSGTESFNRDFTAALEDLAAGSDDDQHAAANPDNLAAAPQDLNLGNDPNEDGAEGNEMGTMLPQLQKMMWSSASCD
jgi:hypothetical protein